GYRVGELYELELLDPAFEMVFEQDRLLIPADYKSLREVFESIEAGSAKKLDKFMGQARFKYETGMNKMARMPGLSLMEFADPSLLKVAMGLDLFSSFSAHVRKFFTHPRLIALMEFPVLFLGAMPSEMPALYSLMNYAGLKLGTWYPKGGFGKVIESMMRMAVENGARFHFNAEVEGMEIENKKVRSVYVNGESFKSDAVVATADYHHVESKLLPEHLRNYDEAYWTRKTFAPSCLIYYLGVSKKIPTLLHHTLFFDEDLDQHSIEIYKNPQWPTKPLFYVCCTSKSDENVAPAGHENLFLLMPIAPGLPDSEETREKYYEVMMRRLASFTGISDLQDHVAYKKSYCVTDFVLDYHSYKGNAYGLANTLRQTAILKPKMQNKKISNLFYAGQLTVPGPGVPPCIISGKIAAMQLEKYLKKQPNETII
ncbi:MAG: phytoene desaturase family protein, partial [Flavisolibacter sp.]